MTNTLIEEVRQARAALAEEHGYDRQRIYEWAREAHKNRKQPKPEQVDAGNRRKPVVSEAEAHRRVRESLNEAR